MLNLAYFQKNIEAYLKTTENWVQTFQNFPQTSNFISKINFLWSKYAQFIVKQYQNKLEQKYAETETRKMIFKFLDLIEKK